MSQKMAEKDSKEEILKAFRYIESNLLLLHFFFSSIWFRLFDDDNSGRITFKNLKRVAKELGENLTDEELQVSWFLIRNFEVKDHLFDFRKWLMKQIAMVMMKSTNKNFYESWKKHHYIKTFFFCSIYV
jgi:hypothetical protein